MTRCPTCRAPFRGIPECHRCGTRLAEILRIEERSSACEQAARRALADSDLASAQGYIDRALFLQRSRGALRTAAIVALARRDFAAACAFWREWRAVPVDGPG